MVFGDFEVFVLKILIQKQIINFFVVLIGEFKEVLEVVDKRQELCKVMCKERCVNIKESNYFKIM